MWPHHLRGGLGGWSEGGRGVLDPPTPPPPAPVQQNSGRAYPLLWLTAHRPSTSGRCCPCPCLQPSAAPLFRGLGPWGPFLGFGTLGGAGVHHHSPRQWQPSKTQHCPPPPHTKDLLWPCDTGVVCVRRAGQTSGAPWVMSPKPHLQSTRRGGGDMGGGGRAAPNVPQTPSPASNPRKNGAFMAPNGPAPFPKRRGTQHRPLLRRGGGAPAKGGHTQVPKRPHTGTPSGVAYAAMRRCLWDVTTAVCLHWGCAPAGATTSGPDATPPPPGICQNVVRGGGGGVGWRVGGGGIGSLAQGGGGAAHNPLPSHVYLKGVSGGMGV